MNNNHKPIYTPAEHAKADVMLTEIGQQHKELEQAKHNGVPEVDLKELKYTLLNSLKKLNNLLDKKQ